MWHGWSKYHTLWNLLCGYNAKQSTGPLVNKAQCLSFLTTNTPAHTPIYQPHHHLGRPNGMTTEVLTRFCKAGESTIHPRTCCALTMPSNPPVNTVQSLPCLLTNTPAHTPIYPPHHHLCIPYGMLTACVTRSCIAGASTIHHGTC